MSLVETVVSIRSGDLDLHGVLRQPPEPTGRVLVVCDPFAEEKKCSHRPLVDTARALCGAGFGVLRFDYRGCGDSPGRFQDFTPADWQADITAAMNWANAELRPAWLGLAGLRTGAALAAALAAVVGVDALVMWEPVIDGARYVAQNLRRSQIKAMMTQGAQAPAAGQTEGTIDFDGYLVGAATQEQLKGVDLVAGERRFLGPTLVMSIGPKEEPPEPYRVLAARFAHGDAVGVRLEAFWNRIGLIDVAPMIAATAAWLTAHGGGG